MVVTFSIRSPEAVVPALSLDAPRIVIGRSRSSDVRVPDSSVSARHATIRQRGAEYLLLDEGSVNGTFVDGHRLSPGSPVLLGRKTAVRVGRVWIDITIEQTAPSDNPVKLTRDIALGLIAGAFEAAGNPCAPKLVVRKGPRLGAELELSDHKRVYTVGRGPEVDLDLGDDDVSRLHLELTRRGGDVLVRDAGSKNGGLLDGAPLLARKAQVFNPGQSLRVGGSELELIDPLLETLKRLEDEPEQVMAEEEHTRSKDPDAKPKPRAKVVIAEQPEAAPAATPAFDGEATSPPKHRRPPKTTRSGWAVTDFLVAGLCLVVLAASIAGIAWLFSS